MNSSTGGRAAKGQRCDGLPEIQRYYKLYLEYLRHRFRHALGTPPTPAAHRASPRRRNRNGAVLGLGAQDGRGSGHSRGRHGRPGAASRASAGEGWAHDPLGLEADQRTRDGLPARDRRQHVGTASGSCRARGRRRRRQGPDRRPRRRRRRRRVLHVAWEGGSTGYISQSEKVSILGWTYLAASRASVVKTCMFAVRRQRVGNGRYQQLGISPPVLGRPGPRKTYLCPPRNAASRLRPPWPDSAATLARLLPQFIPLVTLAGRRR